MPNAKRPGKLILSLCNSSGKVKVSEEMYKIFIIQTHAYSINLSIQYKSVIGKTNM